MSDMDAKFEKLKRVIEAEQGRPLEPAEEVELKALNYFGKGVKLKNELESEPEQIGDICKCVLEDIRGRMQHQQRHGVVAALQDFFSGKKRPKKHRVKTQKVETNLWEQEQWKA